MPRRWIHTVTTTSVSEGPPGTLGHDKTPKQMAVGILAANPDKKKGSILRYMQFVINRAGKRMRSEHRDKIKQAMELVRRS